MGMGSRDMICNFIETFILKISCRGDAVLITHHAAWCFDKVVTTMERRFYHQKGKNIIQNPATTTSLKAVLSQNK
jgi:hypothetical protein